MNQEDVQIALRNLKKKPFDVSIFEDGVNWIVSIRNMDSAILSNGKLILTSYYCSGNKELIKSRIPIVEIQEINALRNLDNSYSLYILLERKPKYGN